QPLDVSGDLGAHARRERPAVHHRCRHGCGTLPSHAEPATTLVPMRRAPIVLIALGAALAASLPAAQGAFPGRDRRVVYAGRIHAGCEIYSMRPNAAGVRKLTNNRLDDPAPVWSPNGKQIAFRSERSGNPEIYVMDADGRHVRRLTHSALPDTKPSWSADG